MVLSDITRQIAVNARKLVAEIAPGFGSRVIMLDLVDLCDRLLKADIDRSMLDRVIYGLRRCPVISGFNVAHETAATLVLRSGR